MAHVPASIQHATTQQGKYYCYHRFTDEDTEGQKGGRMFKLQANKQQSQDSNPGHLSAEATLWLLLFIGHELALGVCKAQNRV